MATRQDLGVKLIQAEALVKRIEAIVDPRLNALALKTIGGIIKKYADGLSSLVYETFNHRMDAVDMRRNMKALMRQLAPDVIIEGFHEGGLLDDAIDNEDRAWVDEHSADWLAEQVQHVNGFAADTYTAGNDKDARSVILTRLDMWVEALRDLGELGKAYAMSNIKGQWKLGDRANHTPDCIRLANGGPHRLSYFIDRGYTPPIHLGCGCRIENVKTGETIMGE